MPWLGMPVEEELQYVDALSRARARGARAAAQWDPSSLAQLRRAARAAPWLKAGELLALGRTTSSMEPVTTLAKASLAAQVKSNPTNKRAGARASGAEVLPGHRGKFAYEKSNFAAGQQYVEMQQRRGAEAEQIRSLKEEGILDERGVLTSPVTPNVLNRYREDPARFAQRRPEQAAQIQRFIEVAQALGGEPRQMRRQGLVGDWTEVPFAHPGGQGFYNPVQNTFGISEPGVQAEALPTLGRRLGAQALAQLPSFAPEAVPREEQLLESSLGGYGELASRLSANLDQLRIPKIAAPGMSQYEAETSAAGFQTVGDVVQYPMMALQAPYQELQGQIRNVYQASQGGMPDWFQPQSDLLISLTANMDPGGGLLSADPDSETAKERLRREEERGLINGQRVTAGRWLASALPAEPGSQPYRVLSGLVDMGLAIGADPTILAGARVSNVARARTLFAPGEGIEGASSWARALRPGFIREQREGAGLIEGLVTNDIHGPTADGFLVGKHATDNIVRPLAQMEDPYEIWLMTNRKLSGADVTAIADTADEAVVRDILRPHLGTTYRTTEDVWNNPVILTKQLRRGMAMVPHDIDPTDEASWLRETENWMRGTRVADDDQAEFMSRMIRSRNNNARWDVLTDIMAERKGVLDEAGFGNEVLRKDLTRLFRQTIDDEGLWFVNEMGDNVSMWHDVAAGDDVIPGVGPHLAVEHIGRHIPLPNYKEIRKLTARYPNLTKLAPDAEDALGVAIRWPTAFLDAFQNEVWKPFTLLRAAWPGRVIGEEQLRMGAAGLHSMFSGHPISFVAWAIGPGSEARVTGRVERALAHVPGMKPRGGVTGLGTPFEESEAFVKALGDKRRAGGFLDERPGRVRTGQWKIFDKEAAGYAEARAEELALLHQDKIARRVAQSDNLDEVHQWLTGTREGREVLDPMIDGHPALSEPNALNRYLGTVAERIDVKTGGNAELLDAIRTGRFRGEEWLSEGLSPTGKFRKALKSDEIMASGPQRVKGQEWNYLRGPRRDIVVNGWHRAVDKMFSTVFTQPDRYLALSPTLRQFHWQRIEELMGHAKNAEQKAILLENARKANLGRRVLGRMERITPRGTLDAEEINALALGYAADKKKELLYDLAEKSQVAEGMRLIAPFGEAWREVVTRWSQLANPLSLTGDIAQRARATKNLRRFQQVILGARGEDFGETVGVPKIWDPESEKWRQPGFFWKDEFGEEVFIMPGSQWITGKFTDLFGPAVPVPLTGRVQGLNMLGQVFPGIGPVAAVPIGALLPDKPGFRRFLRDKLLPFGTIVDEGNAEGWSQFVNPLSYAPPWMKTGIQALWNGGFDQQTNRLWANATKSAADYLYSTGRYDTTSPEGKAQLLHDAKLSARTLYAVQALVAFGAPTAPSKKFLVKSNEGMVRLAMLRDDYYKLLSEDPATADEKFMERWGNLDAAPGKDKVGMAMQAFTREITGGLGVSKEWGDWAGSAEAKYLKQQYPDAWAFFGPQGGEFDYDTYLQQLLKGQRESLTLEEWYDLGQQHLGSMIVDRAKMEATTFDDQDAADQFVADTETWVYENYPGYRTSNEIPGVESRAAREDVMRQLAPAMQDKRVLRTKMGKALKSYWDERLASVDYAASLGTLQVNGPWYDLSRSVDLANDRAYLYDLGQYYAGQDDGFKAIWNRYLRSEVEPSEEDLAAEEEAA